MTRTARIALALAVVVLRGVAAAAPTAPESDSAVRLRLGREAVKAGKRDVARRHFLDAVAIDPGLVPAWCELAGLDAADPDAKALWALDAAWATVDAQGRPPKAAFAPPLSAGDLAAPFDLASKRAALARAVSDAAGRLGKGGDVVVARWLRRLAVEATSGGSPCCANTRAAVDVALDRCRPDTTRLRAALQSLVTESRGAGKVGRAVEAARILAGLSAQRRGAGAPAGAEAGKAAANGDGERAAVEEARTALRAASAAPLPYDDAVARLASDAKRSTEDAHATWGDPLVVTSAKGRYRIESTCGLDTTCRAAALIESCHDRLVAWFGKDPFGGKPGTVRLCPSHAEGEAEGLPYWWAEGFQSGDVTTVVVRWESVDGLARLLQHELTHRFDRTLEPRLPAWALEGRANYVAAATPYANAPAFDERRIDADDLAEAYRWIGDRPEALVAVVDGKDPEYRHNYPVGYALWTFLSQWRGPGKPPDGPAPYRERIPALVAALAAGPASPAKAFESAVCDGRSGRAMTLKQLAKQLSDFCGGFYALDRPAWAGAWIDRAAGLAEAAPPDPMLADRSNFPSSRRRLDPPAEGEGLAAMAATLFEAAGRAGDALEAHAVADAVDEIDLARWRRALALEEAGGRRDAAFARRRLVEKVDPTLAPGKAEPAPAGVGAAASAYLDALARAAASALAAGRPRTARALRAEHDAVAGLVGRAPLGETGLPPAPAPDDGAIAGVPDCAPSFDPLSTGIVEERWSSQDDGRVAGLFGLTAPDELELGRRPGPAVTGEDRDAAWVGTAVRGLETFSGTYTVRMRVRPAGQYVRGRVVLGWTRRDRGVEFTFEAGDREVAEKTGRSVAGDPGAWVAISDLREADDWATRAARHVEVKDARAGFDLALHVSGPYVRAQVDGVDALSLRRPTGEPIEGSLGFVVDRGRTVFAEVRATRHRTLGRDAACRCDRFDAPLDLATPARFTWTSLVGRRVEGLPPSEHVRLLLWSTGLVESDPTGGASVGEALDSCAQPLLRASLPLDVHVAVPGERGADGTRAVPADFPAAETLAIPDGHVHAHAGFPGLAAEAGTLPQSYGGGWPAWGAAYVDPSGVVRARIPFDGAGAGLRLARSVEGR